MCDLTILWQHQGKKKKEKTYCFIANFNWKLLRSIIECPEKERYGEILLVIRPFQYLLFFSGQCKQPFWLKVNNNIELAKLWHGNKKAFTRNAKNTWLGWPCPDPRRFDSSQIEWKSNSEICSCCWCFFSAASLNLLVVRFDWWHQSCEFIYVCVYPLCFLYAICCCYCFNSFFLGANFKWKLLCYEWTRNTVFHLSPLSFFSFWNFVERKHTFPFDWLNGKGVNIYRFLIAANKQPERAVKNKRKS